MCYALRRRTPQDSRECKMHTYIHTYIHIYTYIYIYIYMLKTDQQYVFRFAAKTSSGLAPSVLLTLTAFIPLHSVYSPCVAPRHVFAQLFCLPGGDHRVLFLPSLPWTHGKWNHTYSLLFHMFHVLRQRPPKDSRECKTHTYIPTHIYTYVKTYWQDVSRFAAETTSGLAPSVLLTLTALISFHSVYSPCVAPRHVFAHLFCLPGGGDLPRIRGNVKRTQTYTYTYIYICIKKHQDNRFSVLRRRPPQGSHRVTPLHSVYSPCFAPRHFFAHLFCGSVVDHRIFLLMLPICFETTLAGLHSLHALYSFQFWMCFGCVAFFGGETNHVYMYSRCFTFCGGDLLSTQGNSNHTYSPLFHMCYALRRRTPQDSRECKTHTYIHKHILDLSSDAWMPF